ncbi:MAG: signal peptidase II [Candidatus Omnitrophica bacterium]|nr:signal peptidase II [Candidatus Omnitrophota bacterium]
MILFIVSIILCLDFFTKFLAKQNLSLNEPLPVIKGFFYLTLVHNRGAGFGILKDQAILLVFTSLFAVILIYLGLKKNKIYKKPDITSISLAFILGGALGNLIDRLFLGYVVDFLDFRIWPVFNIADSAITIGAILLGWSILFKKDVSCNL